jgi:hypothetical protein
MDPAGRFLYTAHRRGSDGVSVWRIARDSGELQQVEVIDEDGPRLHQMTNRRWQGPAGPQSRRWRIWAGRGEGRLAQVCGWQAWLRR